MLYGGLGNQLFKFFAATKLLEEGYASNIKLDTSWYLHKTSDLHSSNALFQLDKVLDGVNFKRTSIRSKIAYDLVQRFCSRVPMMSKNRLFVYDDKGNNSNPRYTQRIMLGNFENLIFFPSTHLMLSIFKNIMVDTPWVANIKSKIRQIQPLIVHVRLGDYVKYSNIYGILNLNYYLEAVSRFRIHDPSLRIWLISDDPQRAEEMFYGLLKFDYVLIQPEDVSTLEFLNAVSASDKFVIANSTFSWWAAWLAHHRENNARVVMPSRFHSYEDDIERLYIPGWEIILV